MRFRKVKPFAQGWEASKLQNPEVTFNLEGSGVKSVSITRSTSYFEQITTSVNISFLISKMETIISISLNF